MTDVKTAKLLIDKGAQLRIFNVLGQSPIHKAISKARLGVISEILEVGLPVYRNDS